MNRTSPSPRHRFGRPSGAFALAVALASIVGVWVAPAGASPTFPAAVDEFLTQRGGTTTIEKIFNDMGCHLCHVLEAGSMPHTKFGNLMIQYGTQAEMINTMRAALAAIEQNDPQYIDDLKMGTDPNQDTSMATATNNDPLPAYGCGSMSGARTTPCGLGGAFVAGMLVLALRRGRRVAQGNDVGK